MGLLRVPIGAAVAASLAVFAFAVAPTYTAAGIIKSSIAANDRDWRAQDDYSYAERDIHSNVDSSGHAKSEGSKKFEVLMIEGSPYRKLIAANNEPISAAQKTSEEAKLKREIARRRNEDPGERKKRLSKYQDQR